MLRNLLLFIGASLPLIGGCINIVAILQGKVRPHRATYLLFLFITGLMVASLMIGQDTSGIWLALAAFIQVLIVLALSFKYGIGGRDPFDLFCVGLCLCGIALWWATGESLMGLIAAIVSDFLAALPALRKTIRLPHTEIWLYYALDVLASAAILLAGPYTWRAMMYPLYLLLINLVFIEAILGWFVPWRRHNVSSD